MNGGRAQPVEIVGGGLAGLALGLGLQRAGVPTVVYEAHDYPRHRVCGEFITGLDAGTIARLDIAPLLSDALRHSRVIWHRHDRRIRSQVLPAPALGLSRHALDARLAESYAAAGGDLRVRTRIAAEGGLPGRVIANGRRRVRSPWFGLKVHARGLRLDGDLELHLGKRAYVGLSAVEGAWINVCGLFGRSPGSGDPAPASGIAVLLKHLRLAGLADLARRLEAADIDETSFCAVASIGFHREPPSPGRVALGDAFALTPPFTGNGMAMALQGAALAIDPLRAWSRGELSWPAAVAAIDRQLQRRFRSRLSAANALHPFLLEPRRQSWLAIPGCARWLPLRPLYHLTH